VIAENWGILITACALAIVMICDVVYDLGRGRL
jgi:hypothetical protein